MEQRVPYSGLTMRAAARSPNSGSTAGAGWMASPKARLARLDVRGIEQQVCQAIHAGFELPRRPGAVRHPPQLLAVGRQQVEAAISTRLDCLDVRRRRDGVFQKARDEGTPRLGGRRLARAAIVGHGGKPPAARDAHPGAERLQIAPGQDAGPVAPESRRSSRAPMELVAVRGHDQREVAVDAPRKKDQADTKRSTLRGRPSFAPSRPSSASKAASSAMPS